MSSSTVYFIIKSKLIVNNSPWQSVNLFMNISIMKVMWTTLYLMFWKYIFVVLNKIIKCWIKSPLQVKDLVSPILTLIISQQDCILLCNQCSANLCFSKTLECLKYMPSSSDTASHKGFTWQEQYLMILGSM